MAFAIHPMLLMNVFVHGYLGGFLKLHCSQRSGPQSLFFKEASVIYIGVTAPLIKIMLSCCHMMIQYNLRNNKMLFNVKANDGHLH